MKRLIILPLLLHLLSPSLRADEGMWLPLLIGQMKYEDMRSKGFKLTAEDLYSINNSSLKDAIVIFGRGCTGELISDQGLIITNHHCGYGVIQSHSTIEHDYLTDGFWAKDRSEELPSPSLSVTFLIRMEDVTGKILEGVTSKSTERERAAIIEKNIEQVKTRAVEGTNYTSKVQPFYYGSEYYLFVYEVYNDVRLVGAPPSSIGKFGGDTDNWVWPRHTGDFSLFRIYAGKDNKPAAYSPDNVPYKPKRHLPISLKGIKEGDFTLVYGYPGSTQEYLTSDAVKMVTEYSNPNKIMLRGIRLEIMENYMRTNDTIRLKYSSKNAGVANAWKKWMGESLGLKRMNVYEMKLDLENQFNRWTQANPQRTEDYGQLLSSFGSLYNEMKPLTVARDYNSEAINAIELFRLASGITPLINEFSKKGKDQNKIDNMLESARGFIKSFYKDFYLPIDRDVFANMIKQYYDNVPKEFQPDFLEVFANQYKNNWRAFTVDLYNQTVFADSIRLLSLLSTLDSSSLALIKYDNLYKLYIGFNNTYQKRVGEKYTQITDSLNVLYRIYVKGLREMQQDRQFYPDANSTLRVSYGKVSGFTPRDGVEYSYYTTIDGIIEKDNPKVYDYRVPARLKELYQSKDFGRYQVNGTVPVAFIASNHTSGGNSGSPVIDAEGNLIGINFDRCWEGTMSDIYFDTRLCRNISLDIRYALFIIEKFAKADYLINEMTIVE